MLVTSSSSILRVLTVQIYYLLVKLTVCKGQITQKRQCTASFPSEAMSLRSTVDHFFTDLMHSIKELKPSHQTKQTVNVHPRVIMLY